MPRPLSGFVESCLELRDFLTAGLQFIAARSTGIVKVRDFFAE
jgi:hypothetical protein